MTLDNCSVHGLILNMLFIISCCVGLGEVATWMFMTALTCLGLEDSELTFTARHATSTASLGRLLILYTFRRFVFDLV